MTQERIIPCPVAEWARRAPERIALQDSPGGLTWREWDGRIRACEATLRDAGVEAGARVALALPTGVELLVLLPALFRIGAVACPVDPKFPPAYRDTLLQPLNCAHVFLRAPGRAAKAKADPAAQGPEWDTAAATMIFTSGSSGAPKAAVLSLGNHRAAARASNRNIPLSPGDTWLLSLPLHHVAGLGILFRCIEAGATIALPGGMAPAEAIRAFGATHASLVARQLAQLLDEAPLPTLAAILLGGSAIPGPLLDRAVAEGLPVHTSYGMTEMATQITTTPPGASRTELESAGRPLVPGSIRVADDGTVQVNGAARFLGYWDGDGLRQPFDGDGWFTTGDCGYFDEEGYLHISGRTDNMFVAGGENIQPEAVERALLNLPGVTQAIVVPVPHPEFGATPVAFVECAETIDPVAIQKALSGALPRFKVPRHILPWPTALAGKGMKIKRQALIEEAKLQIGGEHRDGSGQSVRSD